MLCASYALSYWLLPSSLSVASASATKVETIALFKPEVPERPESIQVDRHGIIYVSLAPLGRSGKSTRTTAPSRPWLSFRCTGRYALHEQAGYGRGHARASPSITRATSTLG